VPSAGGCRPKSPIALRLTQNTGPMATEGATKGDHTCGTVTSGDVIDSQYGANACRQIQNALVGPDSINLHWQGALA